MNCNAIVLKSWFPKQNKITIFHKQLGKLSFFITQTHPAAKLCNGALIFCDVERKKYSYQCHFVDIYFIPFDPIVYDLYFIHDLLKICLDFMPWHIAMQDIFDLLITIYDSLGNISGHEKKIFLLKLFLYIGIFPEDRLLYQMVMQETLLHVDQDLFDQKLHKGLDYCWMSEKIL